MFTLKKAKDSEALQQLLNSAKSLLIIKQAGDKKFVPGTEPNSGSV